MDLDPRNQFCAIVTFLRVNRRSISQLIIFHDLFATYDVFAIERAAGRAWKNMAVSAFALLQTKDATVPSVFGDFRAYESQLRLTITVARLIEAR